MKQKETTGMTEGKPGPPGKKILTTRHLPDILLQRLSEAGFRVREWPFIEKRNRPLPAMPSGRLNGIFTSTQAVAALAAGGYDFAALSRAFCVGRKTAAALREKGVAVISTAGSAAELAGQILAASRKQPFLAFTGNLRRPELFDRLSRSGMQVMEVVVYDTFIRPQLLDEQFDHVLFFSPSGIKGYVQGGNTTRATAWCLGPTTAAEAEKHFARVSTAPHPGVESLIDLLLQKAESYEQNQKIT